MCTIRSGASQKNKKTSSVGGQMYLENIGGIFQEFFHHSSKNVEFSKVRNSSLTKDIFAWGKSSPSPPCFEFAFLTCYFISPDKFSGLEGKSHIMWFTGDSVVLSRVDRMLTGSRFRKISKLLASHLWNFPTPPKVIFRLTFFSCVSLNSQSLFQSFEILMLCFFLMHKRSDIFHVKTKRNFFGGRLVCNF